MAVQYTSPNRDTRAGNIPLFQIFGTKTGKQVDMAGSCVEFSYYESVLSNTISATATILESGLTDAKGIGARGVLDNLPIRGGEQVDLIIEDATPQKNVLKFVPKEGKELYVNRVRDIDPGTQKDLYYIDLCTREFIANEQCRVVKRYDGEISKNIKDILTRELGGRKKDNTVYGLMTEKPIEVDKTVTPYNFIGNDKKPFYICTWLASKSAPDMTTKEGKPTKGGAAGYFFYETHDGFKFKSIDKLLDVKFIGPKYIFTNTPDLPTEYNGKILSATVERDIDLQQNLALGSYANRSIFFDYYSMDYRLVPFNLDNQKNRIQTAGKEEVAQAISPTFTRGPSRLMSHILDVGTLPTGEDSKEQLKEWKNNPRGSSYKAQDIMVQSIMRYNQLFSIKLNVIIAGDFSLRAGQLIHCEFPETTVNRQKEWNSQSSGIYMIASLCHRITPETTYTSLSLVRDTFGRKPY